LAVAFILSLLFGYFLYSIRYLFPLWYGTAEFVIGVLLVLFAILGAPMGATDALTSQALLGKFAAGIYIVVRGLDNMSQSRFVTGNPWACLFKCRWGGSGTRRS
jgi:hypothetical protein